MWNFVSRLPEPLSRPFLSFMGQRPFPNTANTGQTNLVVWLEHSGPVPPGPISRHAILRIPGERISGPGPYLSLWRGPGQSNSVQSVRFEGWPRRVERIELVILERDSNYKSVPVGSFQFDNPMQSTTAPWAPDARLTTKSAGDLKVTLLDFATGVGNSTTVWGTVGGRETIYKAAPTNEEPRALISVTFETPRGTNESWFMYDADLSDASGNHVGASGRWEMSTNMVFDPVLWSDESAWKVKLHIKRKTGFSPRELVTFSNVVIPDPNTTNLVNLTNSVNKIETVLKHLIARPPLKDERSWSSSDLSLIRLEHTNLDDTNQIDLVSITVQPMGTNITTSGSSWSDDYREYILQSIPPNATHLDFVFSVQKARFVEFNVAPNWITDDHVIREE